MARQNQSEILSFRLTPKQKEKLEKAADRREVFPSNLAGTIVKNWLLRNK